MTSTHVYVFYRAEFIVISYLIATLGSGTALQVMKQRTGLRGNRNWLLLAGGTVALAAVGIWSMHFIGMQSLQLRDETGRMLQMAFEPGLTVGSLLVAIAIIGVGFTLAGDPKQAKVWRTCIVGFIGGCGVAVMHYMGMLAMVCEAKIHWDAGIIVASVIVGIVAATAALLIFFHLNHIWQDDMRLQVATAMIMGVAVNAMHYTGMVAANWELDITADIDFGHYASNSVILGVIIAMCVVTCGGLLGFLFYRWRVMHSQESAKMQSLTLSIVIRNSQGKILSTLAGTLPSVIIDSAYSGNNTFNRLSPDFLRMLKISFAWQNLSRYQRHLQKLQSNGTVSAASVKLFDSFVSAAQTLSTQLSIPLEHLGFLYYSPTGNMCTLIVKSNHANSISVDHTGSGQLRFLTPQQMKSTLAEFQLPSEVEPCEWLEELKEYQRRVLLPLTGEGKRDELLNDLLREVAGELLPDKDQIESEILSWRGILGRFVNTRHHLVLLARNAAQWAMVHLEPMVKATIEHQITQEAREAAEQAAVEEGGIPAQPAGGAPTVALPQSVPPTPFHRSASNSLAHAPTGGGLLPANVVADRAALYLGILYVQVTPIGLRVMLLRDGPLSMVPVTKLSASHPLIGSRELEMLRDGVTGGGSGQGGSGKRLKLKLRSSKEKAKKEMGASGGGGGEQNGHGGGGNHSIAPSTTAGPAQSTPLHGGVAMPVHTTPGTTTTTVHPSERSLSKRAFPPGGVASQAYLAFREDFLKSVDDLGKLVGSKQDLILDNLWLEVINLTPEVHVIAFVTATMQSSSSYPAHYSALQTSFIPFPIFEIIHFTQHSSRSASAANWTRRLVAATVERGKTRAQQTGGYDAATGGVANNGSGGMEGHAGERHPNVKTIEDLHAAAAAAVADEDALLHSAFGSDKSRVGEDGSVLLMGDQGEEEDEGVEMSVSTVGAPQQQQQHHHMPSRRGSAKLSNGMFGYAEGSQKALCHADSAQLSPSGMEHAGGFAWNSSDGQLPGQTIQFDPATPSNNAQRQSDLVSPSNVGVSTASYKYIPTSNGPAVGSPSHSPPSTTTTLPTNGPLIHYHGERSSSGVRPSVPARVPRHTKSLTNADAFMSSMPPTTAVPPPGIVTVIAHPATGSRPGSHRGSPKLSLSKFNNDAALHTVTSAPLHMSSSPNDAIVHVASIPRLTGASSHERLTPPHGYTVSASSPPSFETTPVSSTPPLATEVAITIPSDHGGHLTTIADSPIIEQPETGAPVHAFSIQQIAPSLR